MGLVEGGSRGEWERERWWAGMAGGSRVGVEQYGGGVLEVGSWGWCGVGERLLAAMRLC